MNTEQNNEYWTSLTTVPQDDDCMIKQYCDYYTL